MDSKGAADAAREYIINDMFPGQKITQLGLEEVVKCGWRKWRVTLGFTPPWYQQAQQGTNEPRIYKDIVIKADGSAISMTGRSICASKSVCKISAQDVWSAEQSAQLGCAAPTSWWDSARSVWRIIFVYASGAAGLASLITLYIKVGLGEPPSVEFLMPLFAVSAGVVIGLVAEGLWWQRRGRQRCGNKKKKRWPC